MLDLLKRMVVKAIGEEAEKLLNNGYRLVDMHVHTRFSDSYTKISSIAKKAKNMGIGVAITDHNRIKGCIRAIRKYPDLFIVPGIEVGVKEGPHVLVYFKNVEELKEFFETYVKPYRDENPYTNTQLPVMDLLAGARKYDAAVVCAHPYGMAYTNAVNGIKEGKIKADFLKNVDGIEIINGSLTVGMNDKALDLAKHLSKGYTGGTDCHMLYELGKVVTCAKAATVSDFIDAIKNCETMVIGKTSNQITRIPTYTQAWVNHVSYFKPYIKYMGKNVKNIVWSPIKENGAIVKTSVKVMIDETKNYIVQPQKIGKIPKIVYKPIMVAVNGTVGKKLKMMRKDKEDEYHFLKD